MYFWHIDVKMITISTWDHACGCYAHDVSRVLNISVSNTERIWQFLSTWHIESFRQWSKQQNTPRYRKDHSKCNSERTLFRADAGRQNLVLFNLRLLSLWHKTLVPCMHNSPLVWPWRYCEYWFGLKVNLTSMEIKQKTASGNCIVYYILNDWLSKKLN